MRLILLRHVVSGEGEELLPDSSRRELKKISYRLRRFQKALDLIVYGPHPAASESARLLAKYYGKAPVKSLDALVSDKPMGAILDWLRQQDNEAAIAIIGEEPALGRLAGFLTTGKPNRVLALKAHGVCCLDLDAPPSAAGAMLKWLLTPMQLKRLKF